MGINYNELVYAGFAPVHAHTLLEQLAELEAGGGGGGGAQTFVFSKEGVLTTQTGAMRVYNDTGATLTISKVRASVGTAPTGATLIVDVNKNGTTIFTTQSARPTIAISGNTATGTPAVTTLADGDYLTVDIDQVGSTVAGSNLTVTVIAS